MTKKRNTHILPELSYINTPVSMPRDYAKALNDMAKSPQPKIDEIKKLVFEADKSRCLSAPVISLALLAIARTAEPDVTLAQQYYQKALDIGKANHYVYANMLKVIENSATPDVKLAFEIFNEALKANKDSFVVYQYILNIHAKQSLTDDKVAFYVLAIGESRDQLSLPSFYANINTCTDIDLHGFSFGMTYFFLKRQITPALSLDNPLFFTLITGKGLHNKNGEHPVKRAIEKLSKDIGNNQLVLTESNENAGIVHCAVNVDIYINQQEFIELASSIIKMRGEYIENLKMRQDIIQEQMDIVDKIAEIQKSRIQALNELCNLQLEIQTMQNELEMLHNKQNENKLDLTKTQYTLECTQKEIDNANNQATLLKQKIAAIKNNLQISNHRCKKNEETLKEIAINLQLVDKKINTNHRNQQSKQIHISFLESANTVYNDTLSELNACFHTTERNSTILNKKIQSNAQERNENQENLNMVNKELAPLIEKQPFALNLFSKQFNVNAKPFIPNRDNMNAKPFIPRYKR